MPELLLATKSQQPTLNWSAPGLSKFTANNLVAQLVKIGPEAKSTSMAINDDVEESTSRAASFSSSSPAEHWHTAGSRGREDHGVVLTLHSALHCQG